MMSIRDTTCNPTICAARYERNIASAASSDLSWRRMPETLLFPQTKKVADLRRRSRGSCRHGCVSVLYSTSLLVASCVVCMCPHKRAYILYQEAPSLSTQYSDYSPQIHQFLPQKPDENWVHTTVPCPPPARQSRPNHHGICKCLCRHEIAQRFRWPPSCRPSRVRCSGAVLRRQACSAPELNPRTLWPPPPLQPTHDRDRLQILFQSPPSHARSNGTAGS